MSRPKPICRQEQICTHPYTKYVTAQARRNPCLGNLSALLGNDTMQESYRIACLEFSAASDTPKQKHINISELKSLLHNEDPQNDNLYGQILLAEDLTKDLIELLGSALDIDPFFFASHIDLFQSGIAMPRPYMSALPSTASHRNFVNLHYRRVLHFEKPSPTRTLHQAMNVPRSVKM